MCRRERVSVVRRQKKAAFTLIEMLVVIGILSLLMALLITSVSSARDAMRRMQCKNNLAQIGRACQSHVSKLGYFPSSGWGSMWTGDPDHGFGATQPGGWIYNILPFLDLDKIHDIGKGAATSVTDLNNATSTGTKYLLLSEAQSAVIPALICPTRRKTIAYPVSAAYPWNSAQPSPALISKTDYAANGGSHIFIGSGPPDATGAGSCWALYPNCAWSNTDAKLTDPNAGFNGISSERSQVTPGNVTNGSSNVFLVGEKFFANPGNYNTGADIGDNTTALTGNGLNSNRWTFNTLMRDGSSPPNGTTGADMFGRRHSQGTHFVFCDGSVKMISYSIDSGTYQNFGIRNSGTISENY